MPSSTPQPVPSLPLWGPAAPWDVSEILENHKTSVLEGPVACRGGVQAGNRSLSSGVVSPEPGQGSFRIWGPLPAVSLGS